VNFKIIPAEVEQRKGTQTEHNIVILIMVIINSIGNGHVNIQIGKMHEVANRFSIAMLIRLYRSIRIEPRTTPK
jgi:hypothetical protein